MRRYMVMAAALLAAPSVMLAATTYTIDPAHSTAQFKVRHMMVSNVTGDFGNMSGTITYDPADPSKSSVEAVIDTTSIDTRQPNRDEDLKSPNFFDVAKFPAITFKSKKVERAGEGKLKVTGDLTMKGVTKEVVLDVEGPSPEVKDSRGNVKSGASATTKLKRLEFGITWNPTLDGGGVVVGDDVAITIEIEMKKQQPAG
ncbi:MAG TPA: YceI family protein [Candidatus Polarisedimenticolia bacterium]